MLKDGEDLTGASGVVRHAYAWQPYSSLVLSSKKAKHLGGLNLFACPSRLPSESQEVKGVTIVGFPGVVQSNS